MVRLIHWCWNKFQERKIEHTLKKAHFLRKKKSCCNKNFLFILFNSKLFYILWALWSPPPYKTLSTFKLNIVEGGHRNLGFKPPISSQPFQIYGYSRFFPLQLLYISITTNQARAYATKVNAVFCLKVVNICWRLTVKISNIYQH